MKILQCAGKTYRITRQRQAILDVLGQADSQPDAAWVYEEVRKSMPNISLGTVQRTMSLLREAGLVTKARPAAPVTQRKANARCHATCIRCGRIVDVGIKAGDELEKRAALATGFMITGHRLDFYGLCPDCIQQAR